MVGLFHFSSFFLKAFETPLPKNIALELVMTKCPSLKSLLGVENFYKLGTWEISICITLNQHFDTEIIWTLTKMWLYYAKKKKKRFCKRATRCQNWKRSSLVICLQMRKLDFRGGSFKAVLRPVPTCSHFRPPSPQLSVISCSKLHSQLIVRTRASSKFAPIYLACFLSLFPFYSI